MEGRWTSCLRTRIVGALELTDGAAAFYLSDEYPAMGVVSPSSLGGTPLGLHLTVTDVDGMFDRAVAAGATTQREPEDQPHGARHGTLDDPYGHRWMLSQPIEEVGVDEYAARSEGGEYRVEAAAARGGDRAPYVDGIWGCMSYADADTGVRFVTEVLGFEELVLVRDEDGRIRHSEYRWPEGGIVEIAEADDGNVFLPAAGRNGLYVVTQDPQAVWDRCRNAGAEKVREPFEPHYDPGGIGFSVRDPEGNAWSFGTYAGGASA